MDQLEPNYQFRTCRISQVPAGICKALLTAAGPLPLASLSGWLALDARHAARVLPGTTGEEYRIEFRQQEV